MFSLGDGTKFWLYSKPTDMRKNFNMLSGIVNNHMGQNLYSGDVFVFVNSANNMMKLLRYEPGGLVIYNKRLKKNGPALAYMAVFSCLYI